MRTVILRLVSDGVTDEELHGVLERPGEDPTPFASTAALLALLRDIATDPPPPTRN